MSDILYFKNNPTFAQLWDACIYKFIYNSKEYTNEVIKLFNKLNLTKKSKMIDLSSGTGFPAIELSKKGYQFDCMDAMDDEIEVFTKKAKKASLKLKCTKLKWLQIPTVYPKNAYDFAFCRGNSFIYAAGGWNKSNDINKAESLKKYEQTLKIFYNILKKGGILYLDKFPDGEKPSKIKIGTAEIKKEKYDLIFYKAIKNNYREASMLLKDKNGNENGLPNMTYPLTFREIKTMMKKVGFSKIKKIKLKSEKEFDILLAFK